jgi:hypothetical protein
VTPSSIQGHSFVSGVDLKTADCNVEVAYFSSIMDQDQGPSDIIEIGVFVDVFRSFD